MTRDPGTPAAPNCILLRRLRLLSLREGEGRSAAGSSPAAPGLERIPRFRRIIYESKRCVAASPSHREGASFRPERGARPLPRIPCSPETEVLGTTWTPDYASQNAGDKRRSQPRPLKRKYSRVPELLGSKSSVAERSLAKVCSYRQLVSASVAPTDSLTES